MKNQLLKNRIKLNQEKVSENGTLEESDLTGFSQWHIPMYIDGSDLNEKEIKKLKKANKYLKYIQKKLIEYSRNGETKRVALLGDILMRRSASFQTMTMNKANKGGYYKETGKKILRELNSGLRGIRNKREIMNINRSYIEKSNGKGRPIGAPDIKSKFVLTGIEKILRIIIEPKLGDYQHGFRNGRSAQTAWKEIISNYKAGNREVYEFDLSAFFNKINVQLIASRLNNIAPGIGNGIKAITFRTNPKFKEYKPEQEIEKKTINGLEVFRKRGFTQGSPISPLMSIYALEFAGFRNIPGLIMYADDGIIMAREKIDLKDYLGPKSNLAGVYLAEDKPHGMVKKSFKFLGLTLDLDTGNLMGGGKKTNILDPKEKNLKEVLAYASYSHQEEKKHGVGKVRPNSLQGRRRVGTRLSHKISEKVYKMIMETLETIDIKMLNPVESKIGKSLQRGGEIFISWKPKTASTHGSYILLDYLYHNSNKKRKNVNISAYEPSESTARGTDLMIENDKIFIRYPHNWGTLGEEDSRLSDLLLTNLMQMANSESDAKLKNMLK